VAEFAAPLLSQANPIKRGRARLADPSSDDVIGSHDDSSDFRTVIRHLKSWTFRWPI